ncbi:MAG: sulfotransferase [Rhodocyclaceae bacterium]|nr:sulfotransferase [Rhodocyclaceae bacterium]
MAIPHTFHFISGLPRSGSTLLSAILRQNPRFHAGVTSPVASFVGTLLGQVGAGSEWSSQVSLEQRRTLLRGLFENYYADIAQPVVFDTNRTWSAKLPLLLDLFPSTKVIACVRNVAWVMDSLERLIRANPYENTRLFANDAERGTVHARVDTLAQRTRLVGLPWHALKEGFYSEQGHALLVIDYELLARRPGEVLPLIYKFLGEESFAHDFERLEFDTPDYDVELGLKGMHKVRPSVGFETRTTLLPPDLFRQYAQMSFWLDTKASRANVITVREEAPAE